MEVRKWRSREKRKEIKFQTKEEMKQSSGRVFKSNASGRIEEEGEKNKKTPLNWRRSYMDDSSIDRNAKDERERTILQKSCVLATLSFLHICCQHLFIVFLRIFLVNSTLKNTNSSLLRISFFITAKPVEILLFPCVYLHQLVFFLYYCNVLYTLHFETREYIFDLHIVYNYQKENTNKNNK